MRAAYNNRTPFHVTCRLRRRTIEVVELLIFSINLNAHHVNERTHLDVCTCTDIRYSRVLQIFRQLQSKCLLNSRGNNRCLISKH